MDNTTNNFDNNNQNQSYKTVPYMGGSTVECPNCHNKVMTRYCPYCSTDLSCYYTVQVPADSTYGQPDASYQNHPQNVYQNFQQQPPQQGYNQYNNQQYNGYTNPYGQYNQYGSYNYNNQTTVQRPPKKPMTAKQIWLTISMIFLFLVVFIGSLIGFSFLLNKNGSTSSNNNQTNQNATGYYNPGGISYSEYSKIKKGMSYGQVSAIIGGDGQIYKSGKDVNEKQFITYVWSGESNQNSLVYITFIDGAVSEISNEGVSLK